MVGGVERVLGRHARLLAADGHAVRVVVARGEAPGPTVELSREPLVDSVHPDVQRVQAELDLGLVTDRFDALRDQLVEALRPRLADRDLVICHNVASLSKNLALTAALHTLAVEPGAPRLVLWHHDLAWLLPRYRPTLHDGHPWDLLRQPWPGAVQVAISRTRADELASLLGLPRASVHVVPNGVDLATTLRLDAGTLALAAATGFLDADPLLLMPARILPRKRIEVGIEVVAALRAQGRPAGLLVTGPADPHERAPGGYLAMLRELAALRSAEASVWFAGAELEDGLSDAVVGDLYALADLLFLPSSDEGFGIPVLEAALHRLPIACTDLAVLREVAGDAALYLGPDETADSIAERVGARLDADPVAVLARRVRHEAPWDAVYRDTIAPLLGSIPARG